MSDLEQLREENKQLKEERRQAQEAQMSRMSTAVESSATAIQELTVSVNDTRTFLAEIIDHNKKVTTTLWGTPEHPEGGVVVKVAEMECTVKTQRRIFFGLVSAFLCGAFSYFWDKLRNLKP